MLPCFHFACRPDELNTHLTDYSFAIKVGKELYVRSIRTIDLASGVVNFYCDIATGEELHLVKRNASLVDTAEKISTVYARQTLPPHRRPAQ